MKLWRSLLLALVTLPAAGQIAVTPYVPEYGFQVLPGSTRQVAVDVTSGGTLCTTGGGNTCTVTWTSTGGITFTDITHSAVSTITGALPSIQVNIPSTTGTCSTSGALGSYAVSSTTSATATATSTDDPTKHATITFNSCAKTTTTIVEPFYQQCYKGQVANLMSWVQGDTNENVTWSIDGTPTGGDGALVDTGNRDAVLNCGTVSGRYIIDATSQSDGSQVGTAIVYVTPNTLPSYTATHNGTRPQDCSPESGMTVYEVGSGYTYSSPTAVPAWASWTLGSSGLMMRIHNTGGSTPSVYHSYIQIVNSGTPSQPIVVCGIDDSGAGYLPTFDGTNATTQSGTSSFLAGYALVLLWPTPPGGHYGYWQGGSAGPSYVVVSGLNLQNANPGVNFVPPGGGSSPWVDGNGCVSAYSGSYIDIIGNEMNACTNGVFTDANATSNAWATITQEVSIRFNHITESGWGSEFIDHQVYNQGWYGWITGNLIDHYLPTALGSCIKDRGIETIISYNACLTDSGSAGPARLIDRVERQDSGEYSTYEGYYSFAGDTNCNNSFACLGDTMGPNVLAGYQESGQKGFDYGNVLTNANQADEYQLHYAEDHDGGMEAQNGTLYSYYNTLDNAQVVYDTGTANNYQMYLQPRVISQNNIFYNNAFQRIAFNRYEQIIFTGLTNLSVPATSIVTPICPSATSCNYNASTAPGWQNGCDNGVCFWPLSAPLNTHIYSLTSGNYPTTSSYPYNPTTYVPSSTSPAVGIATSLAAPMNVLPVRYQFNIATSALTLRTHLSTIGSQDDSGSGPPTVATPTLTPGTGMYSSAQTVTISTITSGASIVYTTDGTTPTVSPLTCTPTNGTILSGTLTVSSSETVNAIGCLSGDNASGVGTAVYTITIPQTATATCAPAPGIYTSAQSVTCTSSTPFSTTTCTADGSIPSHFSPVCTSIPVPITLNIKTLSFASGYTDSVIPTYGYTIDAPTINTNEIWSGKISGSIIH